MKLAHMLSLERSISKFYFLNISILILFILFRILEYFIAANKFYFIESPFIMELKGIYYDLFTWLFFNLIFLLPFLALTSIKAKVGIIWQHVVNILLITSYLGLLITFSERSILYGHEFFIRNSIDTITTVKEMLLGGSYVLIILIVLFIIYFVSIAFINRIYNRIKKFRFVLIVIFSINLLALIFIKSSRPKIEKFEETAYFSLLSNKLFYFIEDCYHYLKSERGINAGIEIENFDELEEQFKPFKEQYNFEYIDPQYPLLHKEQSNDVLSDFFQFKDSSPNIVIILVESLSRSYSGKGAKIGSFTPFIDSLAENGLYWENWLTTTMGSFGVLPSVLGALPYATKGFTNLGKYPEHLSLFKILRNNSYYSYYFSGTSLSFDNFGAFMRMQGTDFILMDFGEKYRKMPIGPQGYGTGYPDDAVYNKSLEVIDDVNKTPYISVYFTVSTHNPYLFEQKPEFDIFFKEYIQSLNSPPNISTAIENAHLFLTSMLFADDCIRQFINNYKKRPEYDNTIFIITGDHTSGQVPFSGNFSIYHTPFVIYSPLLIKSEKFSSLNTHNSIPQTLTALLHENNFIKKVPETTHWIGDVLDTCKDFRGIHAMPLVSANYSISDMLYKNYFLEKGRIYKILPGIKLIRENNDTICKIMHNILNSYNTINSYVCLYDKLYPPQIKTNHLLKSNTLAEKLVNDNENLSLVHYLLPNNKNIAIRYTLSFQFKQDSLELYNLPNLVIELKNRENESVYWGNKKLDDLISGDDKNHGWISCNDEDIFKPDNFNSESDLSLQIYFWNLKKVNIMMKNIKLNLYAEPNQ